MLRSLILLALTAGALNAQTEEFRVYTEHPRLFLRPQRIRLLKRERERQSMRWKQFETLIAGNAEMPEPGFAWGLYFAVTGDAQVGKRAVTWALGPGEDLRQLALVYDWCQDALNEAQMKTLAAKIQKRIDQMPKADRAAAGKAFDVENQRTRTLAALAIAEQNLNAAEGWLRDVVEQWWRGRVAPALEAGRDIAPGPDIFAMCELLHAIRDNLNIDLRMSATAYFKTLPVFEVVSNYPNPYAAGSGEYRIPLYTDVGQPDARIATLARAAGLITVAFDTNALENSYLQGFLIQDRFMLRNPLGAPYEFMWANPYLPGLAYAHLPLLFHDTRSGALFLRSDWEEDATWFALYEHEAQLFRDNKITVLDTKAARSDKPELAEIGDATVLVARDGLKFPVTTPHMFVIGYRPHTRYEVEVDDEEMREAETDANGTLELEFPEGREGGVRIGPAVPSKAANNDRG